MPVITLPHTMGGHTERATAHYTKVCPCGECGFIEVFECESAQVELCRVKQRWTWRIAGRIAFLERELIALEEFCRKALGGEIEWPEDSNNLLHKIGQIEIELHGLRSRIQSY